MIYLADYGSQNGIKKLLEDLNIPFETVLTEAFPVNRIGFDIPLEKNELEEKIKYYYPGEIPVIELKKAYDYSYCTKLTIERWTPFFVVDCDIMQAEVPEIIKKLRKASIYGQSDNK